MNTVKIGVMDNEIQYVEKLSAYLNRYENRLWNVVAFTDKDVLMKYMREKRIDLLAATDQNLLTKLNEKYPKQYYVWLADEKEKHNIRTDRQKIYSVYRYQSARIVGDSLKDIVEYIGLIGRTVKISAVIYSPVGRCGKTMLAKDFVTGNTVGKWLYVGMEDYGVMNLQVDSAEDFLYYVKERREDEVINILTGCDGIIPSPFSMFDTKQIDREDIDWFLRLFEKENMYKGVIFDMGAGIPANLNIMLSFDHIIVPFLQEESALSKRQHFEELITAYELDEIKERMHFIDMGGGLAMEKLENILV